MQEDVLLVHQTISGDEKAFHRLMKKYQTPIYTLILSWVENPQDAEELTQDVFWKAYHNLPALREPARFYPWLRQIAKNHCQDWQRKKQGYSLSINEADVTAEIPPADELVILREAISKVLEVVEKLPDVEKKLLKERYLEDASYEDLQARHGLSYKAINMRLFRARRKVREKVEKMLSGIVAFPWEDAKKLFIGGIETVKISAKAKLATVLIVTLSTLSGVGVFVWHTKPPRQVMPKSVASQSVHEAPTKSVDSSPSNQKISVTSVQKTADLPSATASVEEKEPVNEADSETFPAELEKTLSVEEKPVKEESVNTTAVDGEDGIKDPIRYAKLVEIVNRQQALFKRMDEMQQMWNALPEDMPLEERLKIQEQVRQPHIEHDQLLLELKELFPNAVTITEKSRSVNWDIIKQEVGKLPYPYSKYH